MWSRNLENEKRRKKHRTMGIANDWLIAGVANDRWCEKRRDWAPSAELQSCKNKKTRSFQSTSNGRNPNETTKRREPYCIQLKIYTFSHSHQKNGWMRLVYIWIVTDSDAFYASHRIVVFLWIFLILVLLPRDRECESKNKHRP